MDCKYLLCQSLVFLIRRSLFLVMFFIHHTVPTSMVITCLAYTETCSLISSNITFLAMKSLQVQGLCRFQSYPNGYVTSLRFGFGMTVMMLGFSIVCYHDSILCSLKSRAVTTPCNNGVSKDGDNHLVSSSSPATHGCQLSPSP